MPGTNGNAGRAVERESGRRKELTGIVREPDALRPNMAGRESMAGRRPLLEAMARQLHPLRLNGSGISSWLTRLSLCIPYRHPHSQPSCLVLPAGSCNPSPCRRCCPCGRARGAVQALCASPWVWLVVFSCLCAQARQGRLRKTPQTLGEDPAPAASLPVALLAVICPSGSTVLRSLPSLSFPGGSLNTNTNHFFPRALQS